METPEGCSDTLSVWICKEDGNCTGSAENFLKKPRILRFGRSEGRQETQL